MRLMAMAAILGLLITPGCVRVNVKAPDPEAGSAAGGGGSGSPAGLAPSQLPLSGSWKDIAIAKAGEIFLDTQQGALFYAYDSLAYPGQPVELGARLQSAAGFGGIKDVELEFVLDGQPVGAAKTDESGIARFGWTPPKEGDYEFLVKVKQVPDESLEPLLKLESAPLLAAVRPKAAQFVVIDLDHTVVDAGFFKVLLGGAAPAAGSTRVTRRLAGKYSVIYLTQRPDLLVTKSKLWLRGNDYPAGPLLVSGIRELASGNLQYKQARLAQVMKSYPNVRIGIGDKISDAQVYLDAGLAAYLLPYYQRDPREMLRIADEIETLAASAKKGQLQVVSKWDQIEAGIFSDQQFPADAFVRNLRQEARQLQAQSDRQQDPPDRDDEKDDD